MSDDAAGTSPPEDRPDAHLANLPDGCGCTEMWAHTSERRLEDGGE